MAAFDPAVEMQQIERMDEADVKKELAAAGEKVSGTRRRLNERLHARRCKDAAEAAAADEGDDESPLSDDDLKELCRRKKIPRASTTRHDMIVKLQACGVLDTRGRWDPRDPRIIKIENCWEKPDDFWVTNVQTKEGKKCASTVGKGLMSREGHGGAGIDIPYHQAVFRSKVMALTHVPEDWKEVWESEEAAPYAARALFLLREPAGREYHGANQLDEAGVRYRRLVGGNIVKEVYRSVEGRQVVHRVVVKTERLDGLFRAEEAGAERGVANFAACVAAAALKEPEEARRMLVQLVDAAEDVAIEETKAQKANHFERIGGLLNDQEEHLATLSKWKNETGEDIIKIEKPTALHLISQDCPARPQIIEAWRGGESLGGRGDKDTNKNRIRKVLKPPGWEKRDEKTLMHEILMEAVPRLREKRFRWCLDYLVAHSDLDHIFSGVIDHPSNLYVEFKGQNQHFSDYRNCPAKAARYGAEVMRVAADWIRLAIETAMGIVSATTD